jgi:acylphosphatase
MADRVVRHVRIEGRVQGVWYRGWTVEEARRRGLDGWVRNRRDGSVEAVFAGPGEAVDVMIEACHRGPPSARVERVTASPATEPVPAGFEQRPTA